MLSEKIIVVDDDPRIIKSLKIALTEYELKDFSKGEDALAYLQKPNVIHLILLDVMMPGMDGLTVLEEIKRIKKDMAVIIMTGYGSKDVIVQALRSHADDFIEKPFNMNEMKNKIKILLKEKLRDEYLSADKKSRINRVKRFIERYHKDATLEFISNEMCLSPKYISRMFNAKNNLTFRDFKLKVKMDKAKTLLEKSHLNVNEIAIELGYQNPESFMRFFKRRNKLTPSQYRRKYGKLKNRG